MPGASTWPPISSASSLTKPLPSWVGSLTSIPFDAADRFDCLVTTDVLEHLQMREIPALVRELERMRVPWMAHIINHLTMTPDHMTLKPLGWWARKLGGIYRLRVDLRAPVLADQSIYGLNGDSEHVLTFWEAKRSWPA